MLNIYNIYYSKFCPISRFLFKSNGMCHHVNCFIQKVRFFLCLSSEVFKCIRLAPSFFVFALMTVCTGAGMDSRKPDEPFHI